VENGWIAVVPHLPQYDVRGALRKTYGDKVKDVVILSNKTFITSDDLNEVKEEMKRAIKKLKSKRVALVLTGSYLACIMAYEMLQQEGFDVVLLTYQRETKNYWEARI
jgi:hypothetical protein